MPARYGVRRAHRGAAWPIYILIMKTSTFSATSALLAAAILVASTTSAPVATLLERDTFAAAPGPGFNEAGRTPPLHERRSISDSALGADQPTCPPSGCAAHGRSVSSQTTLLAERQSAMGQDQPRCPSTGCAAHGSGFNEAGRTPPLHERDTFAAAPGPGFNEAGRTPPLHERDTFAAAPGPGFNE
ncbi:hypothetical protein OC834_007824, partial [Tilletia horrida]